MRSLCVHIYHKMSSLSLGFQGVMKHKRSGETKVLVIEKIRMSKMAGTGESKEETGHNGSTVSLGRFKKIIN